MKKYFLSLLFVVQLAFTSNGFACNVINNQSSNLKIVFVNGIANTIDDACSSMQNLATLVGKNSYSYSYFYNTQDPDGVDQVELTWQATQSNLALSANGYYASEIAGDASKKFNYYKTLGERYKNAVNAPGSVLQVANRLVNRIKSELQTSTNKKLVLVAHSQGNFYVEAAYAMLLNEASTNGDASIIDFLQRLRIVGAASVAASTPHNRYLSHSNDLAVFVGQAAISSLTSSYTNYKPLKHNAIACVFSPCTDQEGKTLASLYYVSQLPEGGNDTALHNFQAVYLNQSFFSEATGKSFSSIIVEMIKDSINELNPPPLTVLSTLQAGTYDYSTDMQCYYKNLLGSAVGTNEYTTSAIKYCLNLAQNGWDLSPNYAGLLLYPNGTWGSGNNPNIVITGNTTFTANYGGYAFQNGSLAQNTVGSNYPSGSTSAAISVVDTRDHYILFNNISYITTLDGLISTWNSSFNGQATLSRGSKYGWSFVTPPVTDYTAGIYKLYDISQNSTCTTTGTGTNAVTTCGRPVLAQGAWTKNTLSDGSPSIELNVYSPYTDLLLFGNTGERALYVKRAVDIGVREGVRRISGGVHSFNAVNRTYMNADLAARKTSNGNTYPATVN